MFNISRVKVRLTVSKLLKYDLMFGCWHAQFFSNHVLNLKVLWFWFSIGYYKPYGG